MGHVLAQVLHVPACVLDRWHIWCIWEYPALANFGMVLMHVLGVLHMAGGSKDVMIGQHTC